MEVVVAEEEQTEQDPEKGPKTGSILPSNKLSKESDRVARPGFRNPPNQRSKAMKASKKKKR